MLFIYHKDIQAGVFFIIRFHARVNLMCYKIRKIPSLVDFHSLYQLLHSQVYRNGLLPCC